MANYCWNCVSFYGKKKDVIEELKDRIKSYPDFNYVNAWGDYVCKKTDKAFVYNYKDDSRPYYFYGTKWWDFEIINEDKNEFMVSGDSAWSPPIELIKEICKVYNITAEIEYDEPGMDFAGKAKFNKNGLIYEEEMTSNEFQYKENKDYWIENLKLMYTWNEKSVTFEEIQEDHPYASQKDILELIETISLD